METISVVAVVQRSGGGSSLCPPTRVVWVSKNLRGRFVDDDCLARASARTNDFSVGPLMI